VRAPQPTGGPHGPAARRFDTLRRMEQHDVVAEVEVVDDEVVEEELLVEEISIDGMCGVY
jgi:mycofactocin precursor